VELGIIGCGRTATAVVDRLLAAGHQLRVFAPPTERAEALEAAGAAIADSLLDACNADAVITMLPSDRELEKVVLGDGGVAAVMPAASVHISMSTIGIDLSRRLTEVHARRVQRYLSAPVIGLPHSTAGGEICIFVAGRADTVSRCNRLFDVMGDRRIQVGEDPAEANLLHLCALGLIGSLVQSLREATFLADKGGIAPERFLALVSQSASAKPLFASYGNLIGARTSYATVTVEQGREQARLLADAANILGAQTPLMRLVRAQLDALANHGLGGQGWMNLPEDDRHH